MASNGIQPGYEDAPAFPVEDAVAEGIDAEELARYVVKRGNLYKGPAEDREALETAVDGVFWYDTTFESLFMYRGEDSTWLGVWTPPLIAQLISNTSPTNGTVTLSWNDALDGHVDRGGFFSAANATRVTAPRSGWYRVTLTVRHNTASPHTVFWRKNGSAIGSWYQQSAVGASGAASMSTRTMLINLGVGEYLDFRVTSDGSSSGSHSLLIEYLTGV